MNKSFFLVYLFIYLCKNSLFAQFPTAVIEYQFGTSQTVGQESEYFPNNILGSPAQTATPTAPASSPFDIVSLGKGGYVILYFENSIINQEGADFTVFENAFYYQDSMIFDEWLRVSVSQDGQNWYNFPVDTVTGVGFAGRTPTLAPNNYLDPNTSGGDVFDLEILGLSSIDYIKISDATNYQTDSTFQPARLSAELDAVVALHTFTEKYPDKNKIECKVSFIENGLYILNSEQVKQVWAYDIQAKLLNYFDNRSNFNNSIYMPIDNNYIHLYVQLTNNVFVKKLLKSKI